MPFPKQTFKSEREELFYLRGFEAGFSRGVAAGRAAMLKEVAEWCGDQEGLHMKADCLREFSKVTT